VASADLQPLDCGTTQALSMPGESPGHASGVSSACAVENSLLPAHLNAEREPSDPSTDPPTCDPTQPCAAQDTQGMQKSTGVNKQQVSRVVAGWCDMV
jgi:hypothetical protein